MTKRKVAYNACFGGFSISEKAVKRAREISGNPKWGGVTLWEEKPKDPFSMKFENLLIGYGYSANDLERHDPVLVQVIEELGDEASGKFALLRIEEVDGPYRIDEYDGNESVTTPDSYDWS